MFSSKKEITYNPANEKAKAIADKIMKGRQKIAQIKSQEHESVFTKYLSILTVGIPSMSLEDCLALTIYQFFDLLERYSLYVAYNIDLRVRLAGGSPDKEAENWMKNIH